LRSFKIRAEDFLARFADLLDQMPSDGLILDIRDNPGGYIHVGEQLLQTLSPGPIEPETAQFINSPVSLAVCRALSPFERWRESMQAAIETGSTYSAGLPISDKDDCNRLGQRYYGPVILVTSALCYSTADIFAAGFQDHGGTVLGVDSTTGAGGAQVITHSALCTMYEQARKATARRSGNIRDWPLDRLKAGDLRFAIRRTLRIGKRAGSILEDFGVESDILHNLTKNDLLHNNIDLVKAAAEHLALQPVFALHENTQTFVRETARVAVDVRTRGLDRLDIAVDGGWASPSMPVRDGVQTVVADLPPDGAATHLTLRGFKTGGLVASRKIRLPPPTQ
jgi:hypothetical protein